ncbi:MAG: hypothetical protein WBD34_06280 [Burkholderiaceae bacterium]
MPSNSTLRLSTRTAIATVAAACGLISGPALSADNPVVVELTQVHCQFIESEHGRDHQFRSNQQADCEKINADSGKERLAQAKILQLKPGKTIFRVTNKNVDYSLGFYVRGDGLINHARLPKVSGGGLTRGVTKDYEIELVPGEYVYSCPLNPTLDYKLIVKG